MPAPSTADSDPGPPRSGLVAVVPVLTMALALGLLVLMAVVSLGDYRFQPQGGWASHLATGSHRTADGVDGGRVIETRTVVRQQLDDVLPSRWHPLVAELGLTQLLGQQWQRTTLSATTPGPVEPTTWITRFTGGSVLLLARTGSDPVLLDPMPVLLPGDQQMPAPAASSRWQSEGTAHPLDGPSVPYTFEATLAPADDAAWLDRSCAAVTLELALGGADPLVERLVLCPQAGIVDRTGAEERRRSLPPYPAPTRAVDGVTGSPADTARWAAVDGTLVEAAVTAPSHRLGVRASQDAVVTADARGQDLIGWRPSSSRWRPPAWRVHPGQTMLTTAVVSDVVLAGTTARTVVAYDGAGHWLWQQPSPDVVTMPPTDLGAGLVGVVDRSGVVQVRDLHSGVLRWQRDLRATVTVAPASDPVTGLLGVLDDTGTLTVLSREGELDSQHEVDPLSVESLLVRERTVFLADSQGVRRIDPGGEQWEQLLGPGELLGLQDGLLIHRSGTVVVALSAVDGRTRWRVLGSGAVLTPEIAGAAGHVVLVQADVVVARTPAGEVVARTPLTPAQLTLALGTDPFPVLGPEALGVAWLADGRWLFWGEQR